MTQCCHPAPSPLPPGLRTVPGLPALSLFGGAGPQAPLTGSGLAEPEGKCLQGRMQSEPGLQQAQTGPTQPCSSESPALITGNLTCVHSLACLTVANGPKCSGSGWWSAWLELLCMSWLWQGSPRWPSTGSSTCSGSKPRWPWGSRAAVPHPRALPGAFSTVRVVGCAP